MIDFLDFIFPSAVTRDQLGTLGGDARFTTPWPPVAPGQVFYGVRVGDRPADATSKTTGIHP